MSDLIKFLSVLHIIQTPNRMRRILFLTNFSCPYFSSMGDGSLEKSLAPKIIFLISFLDFLMAHYTSLTYINCILCTPKNQAETYVIPSNLENLDKHRNGLNTFPTSIMNVMINIPNFSLKSPLNQSTQLLSQIVEAKNMNYSLL